MLTPFFNSDNFTGILKGITPLFFSVFLMGACATGTDEQLDKARFALDAGDYSTAISQAKTILDSDTTNLEAAMILSSAYSGSAGLELTKIADDIMDTAGIGGSNDDFNIMHDKIVKIIDTATKQDDFRNAINTLRSALTKKPASGETGFVQYSFQLGLLQTISALSFAMMKAQPTETGTIDPSLVTADHRTDVENDFLEADNNLIAAKFETSNDLIETLRQNYCALKDVVAGDVGGQGFSLTQLRDLVRCQLGGDTNFEALANCAVFIFNTCGSAGDTTK